MAKEAGGDVSVNRICWYRAYYCITRFDCLTTWRLMKSEELVDEALKRVSSFSERLGKEEYFTGAGHLNILVGLRRDIAARIPLLVLTGGEGCGKSVLGRMAASEVRSGCLPVYFDQGIESFEDLVSTVAEQLDIELAELTRDSVAEAMDRIAAGLAGRNQRLLLICDGAERIYLATLERLRKMMDRLNRVVVSLQVVLIGRPQLLDNLRQLSICNFQEVEEKRYILESLTQAETKSYLEFCKKKLSDDERSIFTPETIDRLYRESGGNFKKIQFLAEQLCNRYNKDASFWVLLENVEGGPLGAAMARVRSWPRLCSCTRFALRNLSRRQQLAVTAAVSVALMTLLFMAWPGRQQDELPTKLDGQASLQSPVPVESAPMVEERAEEPVADVAPDPHPQRPLPQPVESPDATGPSDGDQSVGVEMMAQSAEQTEVPEGQTEGVALAEQVQDPTRQQLLQAEVLLSEARAAVETARRDDGPELVGRQEAEMSAAQAESSGAFPELMQVKTTEVKILPVKVVEKSSLPGEYVGGTVPVLHQERGKKMAAAQGDNGAPAVVRAVVEGEAAIGTMSGEAGVPVIRSSKRKQKAVHGTGAAAGGGAAVEGGPWLAALSRSGTRATEPVRRLQPGVIERRQVLEPLEAEAKKIPFLGKAVVPEKKLMRNSRTYFSRVAAGEPWLSGAKDGSFTMQLLALSSDSAQENVQEILSRAGYAAEADHLYIFEKKGGEPAVFVFFGEYASSAAARAARENLPAALEKYQPYVLSVREAMQKMR